MKIYVLDANFFIQAHRFYYPFDVFKSFWTKIKSLANENKIISIDKVKDEIYRNEDSLTEWCVANLPDGFFKSSDDCINSYSTVVNWANSMNSQYTPRALNEFLEADIADPWLVAYGHKNNCTVITYEKMNWQKKSKVFIPEACEHLEVLCFDTIAMLRELGEEI
ncbi:MAG: DUF4411 family protein [Lewinellaceae bacterium]|nr:DUF4411 family protein [Lewinellaceae bacterium]